MKTSSVVSLLLLSSSTGCATFDSVMFGEPAQHVVHEHDRFNGTNSMWVDLGATNLSGFGVQSSLNARRDEKRDEVWLTMEVRAPASSGWQYARCHTFDLLADDQPVPHGEEVYSMDLKGSWPHETIKVSIPVAQAKRLADISKFEGRLCQNEFALGRAPVEWLKAFARELR